MLHGLSIAGLLFLAYVFVVFAPVQQAAGWDAWSYWSHDPGNPYAGAIGNYGGFGAFRYAPPIAQLLGPIHALPWTTFLWLWLAVNVASLIWLGGRWALALCAIPLVPIELYMGNIHLPMAVAIALGFRHPWTWSFIAFTKVTPFVGVLWFAARGQWRSFAIALGATAAIASVSFVFAPGLWASWIGLLGQGAGVETPSPLGIPLPVRLAGAVVLILWGARTDRVWTVPIAATMAMPALWWTQALPALAVVPLLRGGTKVTGATESRRDPSLTARQRTDDVRGIARQPTN